MQTCPPTNSGLGLMLKNFEVTGVGNGPAFGLLQKGDVITHVNSVKVDYLKNPQAMSDAYNDHSIVELDIKREGNCQKIYLSQSLLPGVDSGENLIVNFFRAAYNESNVHAAFRKYSDVRNTFLPSNNLKAAIAELDFRVSDSKLDRYLGAKYLRDGYFLDREAFKKAVETLCTRICWGPMSQRHFANSVRDGSKVDFQCAERLQAMLKDEELAESVLAGKSDDFDQEEADPTDYTTSQAEMPNDDKLEIAFVKYSVCPRTRNIGKGKVKHALEDLGLLVDDDDLSAFVQRTDLNGDGLISFEEFQRFAQSPPPLESWAASLPLSSLLVQAFPEKIGRVHLRSMSELTPYDIDVVVNKFCSKLRALLRVKIDAIKKSFASMLDKRMQPNANVEKFRVGKMQGGSVADFRDGLNSRLGPCRLDFFNGLEAEHCTLWGHGFVFSTRNYKISTYPQQEWEIVLNQREPTSREGNRRIPDIGELCDTMEAAKANLTRAEVIALVLYTGPMYELYNTMLRREPSDIYLKFKKNGNRFSTTIHLISSAVQKLSHVERLPEEGLRLYRGLGGTMDLPDSFFQMDENGCTGFVDWGFMSTTTKRSVAIDYSGVNAKKPLPVVLVVDVSAVDKGARISAFSQYQEEDEYLFAPCCYVEQKGPKYLDVTDAGVVEVYPVKVNANFRNMTVDRILEEKKRLHMESFKFLVEEIHLALRTAAERGDALNRLKQDSSAKGHKVEDFIEYIVDQCNDVLEKHGEIPPEKYTEGGTFRSLVMEMVNTKLWAVAKFQEWLQNKQSSFIQYRFKAQLRTAYRRYLAYLQREVVRLDSVGMGDKARELCLLLCKDVGLIVSDVDERNELHETGLLVAAAEGRAQHIELLVRAGSGVNATRPDGVSAVWLAAQFGHVDCICKLVQCKASVNHQADDGATPVYIAAQGGNVACIQALAALKAEVGIPDKKGTTPVHQAAMNGHGGTLELLRALKADLTVANKEGKTPLAVASALQEDGECARILERLLAET